MTTEVKTGMAAVLAVTKKAALARELDITRGAVQAWVRNDRVPAERIGDVARITGLAPEILRPDLFTKTGAAV